MLRLALLFGLALTLSAGAGTINIIRAPGDGQSAAWRLAEDELATALAGLPSLDVRMDANAGPEGEGYQIRSLERNAVVISARDLPGRVYGTLRLARELRLSPRLPRSLELSAAPAYRVRMVEVEAPFYPPEDRPERPYWLGGYRAMYDLPEPPYLDLPRFGLIEARFQEYCRIMLKNGYNALLFVQVESRWIDPEIWSEVSLAPAERERLRHWRALYGRLLEIARDYGFRCYLWISEVTLPEAVMARLRQEGAVAGAGLRTAADTRHPALQAVLDRKYRYLAESYPQLAGFLFRVGELGEPGAVVFRAVSPEDARSPAERVADFFGAMQRLVVGELGREMIARTWWVGHPSIHTDPELHRVAVSQLSPEFTAVCVKHTHEFWGHLPINPTLAAASHELLVEFQGFREYDGMGSHPVVLSERYAARFRELLPVAPTAMWTWVKFGGSGGKYRLPYFHGMEDWTEANVYILGRLAWEPEADPAALRREFAVQKVGRRAWQAYARILELCEEARDKGLYVKAVCDENPWHPMFPVYRNYFYAGEIIAAEDGVRSDDPVGYLFEHYRERRSEMLADMRRALALRRETVRLAERATRGAEREYAEALVASARHGLALQQALTAWIECADLYYAWQAEGRPEKKAGAVRKALRRLKQAREDYDRDFGEYVDRQSGMMGFITRAEKGLLGES